MEPKKVCSCLVVLLSMLLLRSLHAQELTLVDGTTTLVAKGDAACVTQLTVGADTPFTVKEQGCSNNRATALLNTGFSVLPKKVDLTASTRFVKQFHVELVPGAPKSSFLPVLIAVPVKWVGSLLNDNVDPPLGPLERVVGHADVDMFLRLTEGTPGNPEARGITVEESRFNGASHAGLAGCLSIPTSEVDAAVMGVNCALTIINRDEGSGNAYLSAVVETGKTYNIEIELLADVFSPNTAPAGPLLAHPFVNFDQNVVTGAAFGLTWADSMSITVGTDAQSLIQGLQNEITLLQQQLGQLRGEFLTHTHIYLTGKGVGQNNTKATTTPPLTSP
jgi:hypothetical protein